MPNSITGRTSTDHDIYGVDGVPPEGPGKTDYYFLFVEIYVFFCF